MNLIAPVPTTAQQHLDRLVDQIVAKGSASTEQCNRLSRLCRFSGDDYNLVMDNIAARIRAEREEEI